MALALLVLAIWLAASSLPMPQADPAGAGAQSIAALLAGQTICHAIDPHDGGPSRHGPIRPPGRGHDCGMCPICHFMGTLVLAPAPDGVLAAPVAFAMDRLRPAPTATAPPPAPLTSGRPRGPPVISV
jgi:hypothetical protein